MGATADGARLLLLVTCPAGVGKTALVLRWAHRNADAFPDGRIGVNLRGFDETEPLSPEEPLTELLRGLGADDGALPADRDEPTAYRTLPAGLRVLLVLENARDAEQVLPLLPAEPGCAVVVTSRHRLTGLLALDGARALALGSLDAEEAFGVPAGVAGRPRPAGGAPPPPGPPADRRHPGVRHVRRRPGLVPGRGNRPSAP
ncbi:hypothetical protein [Kitasatospora sp. NPDC085464]|uniref:hypothetical protein n=1 Tax=Kitasatospora sp. NPDC085464 TaxID=3364063 RepID=UPI0037CBF5E3